MKEENEPTIDRSESTDDLDDSVVAEENAVQMVKTLREKLKAALAEKQEYLLGWQRTKADLINARKRDEEEKREFIKYSNEGLINELLPVIQSFDMAMGNKEVWEKVDKNWRVGVEYIASQLKKVLEDNGLVEINPIGLTFDPTRDDAAEYVPVTDEKQNHAIISVIQKGYSLKGKVVRAPRVKVGEFKKE